MSLPIDSLPLFPLSKTVPTDTVSTDNLLSWWSGEGVRHWRDENGETFAEGLSVETKASSYTVAKGDRNTVIQSTGTTDVVFTLPAATGDEKLDFPPGSVVVFLRGDTGKCTIDLSNVSIVGSPLVLPWDLRPGETLICYKLISNFWKITPDSNKEFTAQNYAPDLTNKTKWLVPVAAQVNSIDIPTSAWPGTIAVGLETSNSGGIMAIDSATLAPLVDPFGSILNAVELRADTGELLHDGNGHRILGLLRTTAVDGAINNGTNLTMDFVYIEVTTGAPVASPVSRSVLMGPPVALAAEDMPHTL